MTLLLWIITAVCFIGWIWQGVCASIVRGERDQTKSSYEEMQGSRDYYRKNLGRFDTHCNELERERDELRETLARVAEAVKAERQASQTTIRQLEQLYSDRCGTTWARHVYDYLDQHHRDTARKHYDADNNRRVMGQIETAPEATTFLDKFIAERAGEKTDKAEE